MADVGNLDFTNWLEIPHGYLAYTNEINYCELNLERKRVTLF